MDQRPSLPAARQRRQLPGLLPLALLLCAGCGPSQPIGTQPAPPMPVASPLRKQVLQGYMPFGSISWLNDKELVFHGVRIGGNANRHNLYLWDLAEKPKELVQGSHHSCVSKGIIRTLQYQEQGSVKPLILKGPDFRPRPSPPRRPPPRLSISEPVSCTSIAMPDVLRGRQWKPLRPGQGYLDFGPNDDAIGIQAVQHLTADQRRRHDTGIRMEGPMTPSTDYAAHDDSYLIYDINLTPTQRQNWLKTNDHIIWRFSHGMQAQPLNIPAGSWVNPVGGTLTFHSVRPGLLIISNNFAPNHSAGGAGLYLLAPRAAAERLERGLVEEAAVSPNGCRIAYGFRPRLDTGIPEGGPRLVALDVCRPDISKDAPP